MTQPAKAQEPSMEDILASIRRIIADDDATGPPAKAADPPPTVQSFHYPQAGERGAPPPQSRPGQQSVSPAEPLPRQDDETAEEFEAPQSYAAFDKPRSDVLNLAQPMAAAAVQQPENVRRMDRSEVVAAAGSDDEQEFRHVRADLQRPDLQRPDLQRPLLSSATSTAVNSAFNALAQTVLVQNARTLEDLVKEMLRPLLKTWLDDNLPGLVERLVRTEIERVSRGRS
jgi:cell pole-organizing protein PopZ